MPEKKSNKPVAAKPIVKFETVIKLPDAPKRKSRQRRSGKTAEPTRVLSEEEQRKKAAWQEVEQSGKPIVFDGSLLVPEGMSPWEAIEHLPDGKREATEQTMQQTVIRAFTIMVRGMRKNILEKAEKHPEWGDYHSFSYAAQMAIADMLVRAQNGMPEIPLEQLLKRYGATFANEQNEDGLD